MATKSSEAVKTFAEQQSELDAQKVSILNRRGEIRRLLEELEKDLGTARMQARSTMKIHAQIKELTEENKEINSQLVAIDEALQIIRDEAVAQRVKDAQEGYIQAYEKSRGLTDKVLAALSEAAGLMVQYEAAIRQLDQFESTMRPYNATPKVDPIPRLYLGNLVYGVKALLSALLMGPIPGGYRKSIEKFEHDLNQAWR
jgi:chromosome segregation ATPase